MASTLLKPRPPEVKAITDKGTDMRSTAQRNAETATDHLNGSVHRSWRGTEKGETTQSRWMAIGWAAFLGGCLALLGCGGEATDSAADEVRATGDPLTFATAGATKLFIPPSNPGAVKQIASLIKAHDSRTPPA